MGSWCLRAIAAAVVVLFGLAQSPSYAGSDAVFDEQETRAIGDLVREYIQKNPEIVLEALQELKSRQRLAEAETLRRQIEAKRDSLSNDPGSPIGGSPEGENRDRWLLSAGYFGRKDGFPPKDEGERKFGHGFLVLARNRHRSDYLTRSGAKPKLRRQRRRLR